MPRRRPHGSPYALPALAALLVLAASAPADAAIVLLSRRNQQQVHTWDSTNPGASVLLHSVQCNDADYNVAEGSTHGWIAEHFTDHFGRFVVGSGNGLNAQYDLGQNGLTHYDYPKHVTVYGGEVVVMSRNDGTLWRYTPDGVQLGSVKTPQNTGQGIATDGVDLYVSLWTGSTSQFVRYDPNYALQSTIANPSGMGNFNNLVDMVYDPGSGHFFGLATTGEGGTGTESTTVLEFEMGGAVIKSYPLPFACDGIGVYNEAACGNGKVEGDEACDDGNADNSDECLDTCALASCGDGFVQDGVEACDDGNDVDIDECTGACASACGDGFVQDGVEACDDGNAIDGDAHQRLHEDRARGDGVVQDGVEACDDGNDVDDDECTNACTAPTCGDGSSRPARMRRPQRPELRRPPRRRRRHRRDQHHRDSTAGETTTIGGTSSTTAGETTGRPPAPRAATRTPGGDLDDDLDRPRPRPPGSSDTSGLDDGATTSGGATSDDGGRNRVPRPTIRRAPRPPSALSALAAGAGADRDLRDARASASLDAARPETGTQPRRAAAAHSPKSGTGTSVDPSRRCPASRRCPPGGPRRCRSSRCCDRGSRGGGGSRRACPSPPGGRWAPGSCWGPPPGTSSFGGAYSVSSVKIRPRCPRSPGADRVAADLVDVLPAPPWSWKTTIWR
ncbi:MAG: hypothetical protein R3B09_18750 [Nannocystaceae bacterium]